MKALDAAGWHAGNRVRLLENGEQFFARAFEAIRHAREEVLLETFILFEDKVGLELHRHLVDAGKRGVRVEVTVDGYGSPRFSPGFLEALAEAGVRFRVFDPKPTLFGLRLNVFRRMHRKLLVVDRRLAFVGGINYSADHLSDFGPAAKRDYAVELEGPAVGEIRGFLLATLQPPQRREWRPRRAATATAPAGDAGGARVLFEYRDNAGRSAAIERRYRDAFAAAERRIVIANAYFFPSHGFLRDLRRAARRSVEVALIVQGEPDVPLALSAARVLYRELMQAGVRIYEYCERPFHGKVALIDDDWATVGSSNLDPLSLSLNLEANVFIRDRGFNRELGARLDALIRDHCRLVEAQALPPPNPLRNLVVSVFYHVLRHFPSWAGLLPAHTPDLVLVTAPDPARPEG
ncbi:cardiolipin synthase ClsB [Vulcaniibacterium tengchongense]|uniref:Cardiolipin synthase B n=1 Tax=Vulcaniibacterium tengchongense TaxID=1273429 RepID=A0A3N4VBD3_9GAMM|nr:cardiolipin synthase ClsB [Vulcaniibacterium tengchongense]RPE76929.1 cardiolipin synthase [Vulcaniibacterium tengchongense]